MRRVAWALLLVLTFAIPWEYSLDFGEPFGNLARIAVIGVVLALVPAILKDGQFRTPGVLQIVGLGLLLWFCVSCLWTIDIAESMRQLRGYFQEIVIVWLVWELVGNPKQLRWVLRAYVAGAGVLAALTIINFVFASNPEQIRFKAAGQDPNDVARFLNLGLPLAGLLAGSEAGRFGKLLAGAYLPIGALGILLTASRSGLICGAISLMGCVALFFFNNRRALASGVAILPALAAAAWFIVPIQTLARLGTLPAELVRGDLNQRADIWAAGWQAYTAAPFLGYGTGSFVAAAGVAPIDTAHNTALVVMVEGGVVALLIAAVLAVCSVALVLRLRGPLRIALGTALLAWMMSSFAATVQQNRATWLLLGIIAAAARLFAEDCSALALVFPRRVADAPAAVPEAAVQELP